MAEKQIETLPKELEKEVLIDLKERTFYPIIKSGDWVGIKHGAVYSILVGPRESPQVVIGFGYDTPDNFIFLTHQDSEKIDVNATVNEAFENIDAMDVIFTPSNSLDNKVLTASGLPFSSEAILSKKQMLKAHEILSAKQLLVSIARRTGLMVISKDAPEELLSEFIYLHNHAWNDDSYGNAPIANMLFVIENGEIAGSIPLESEQ
ncbi:hypothetical protein [Photobacterium kagoshimensis]|uniref:hypothetical protein n=1 Tax=Photobacterium kagoshimensis TaxID=2910242 RepID=UPI003D117282